MYFALNIMNLNNNRYVSFKTYLWANESFIESMQYQ